jgi:opacity protein-like surface antigen
MTSLVNPTADGAPVGLLTTEVERTCQVHVGPHVGITTGGETGLSPLIYATGGYAGACDKLTQTGQFTLAAVTNTSVSTSDFKSGWFLGAGVDLPTWCLIPGTFVQIEYTHSDYGSAQVALAGTTTTGRFENRTDEVRFGFKYLFAAASPSVSPLK